MAVDHIRYDLLVQDALRGMVRNVLIDAATKGLVGDHHFFITFDTTAAGVQISDWLHERYPQEMTIVLQHQFWDLKVNGDILEVGLSFSGVAERLTVPLAAIKSFADPSVQFALQFETVTETADTAQDPSLNKLESEPPEKVQLRQNRGPRTSVPNSPPLAAKNTEPASEQPAPSSKTGAEVVRLDRFRKK